MKVSYSIYVNSNLIVLFTWHLKKSIYYHHYHLIIFKVLTCMLTYWPSPQDRKILKMMDVYICNRGKCSCCMSRHIFKIAIWTLWKLTQRHFIPCLIRITAHEGINEFFYLGYVCTKTFESTIKSVNRKSSRKQSED